MKAFTNANPKDVADAVALARRARAEGRAPAYAGGGSDLLGMMKDRLVTPDVVVNLKAIGRTAGLDRIDARPAGLAIGGLVTLDALASHAEVRTHYTVLAEAAEGVATPQIRNVGTLAGNVCQRPWCWYYRNGFPCYKAGGNQCFSFAGENRFHAIFGGGPSYIVHPSDTAPALVALGATFHLAGPGGERDVLAADFFVLPSRNAAVENVLEEGEMLASVHVPKASGTVRSTYQKVLDREAWTHAVVSAAAVFEIEGGVCRRARLVLGGVAPIPWRLTAVERLLEGQRITPALAERAGATAVEGARPLAHNAYKVPLTRNLVKRTVGSFA
jgi:xanthine dehydrogenase YagS FAD-binding subunit